MTALSQDGWQKCWRPYAKITSIAGYKSLELLYGENPHQKATLSVSSNRPGVVSAKQLQGKPLTYNNINDTDAAFELVSEFRRPTIAIINIQILVVLLHLKILLMLGKTHFRRIQKVHLVGLSRLIERLIRR